MSTLYVSSIVFIFQGQLWTVKLICPPRAVNNILTKNHGLKVAVIENEFGEVLVA